MECRLRRYITITEYGEWRIQLQSYSSNIKLLIREATYDVVQSLIQNLKTVYQECTKFNSESIMINNFSIHRPIKREKLAK